MIKENSPKAELKEVLVLEPDRLRGAVVARTVSKLFPVARVYCESEPSAAALILAERDIELFIVALRGFDLDILTLLGVWAEHGTDRTRVLVMTPSTRSAAIRALRSLPISGIYDSSSGDMQELEFACRAVASGITYWHHRIMEEPIDAGPLLKPVGVAITGVEEAFKRSAPPKNYRPRSGRRRL